MNSLMKYGLAAGLLIALAASAAAQPQMVSYQGYLTDDGGNPLDGAFTMEFGIYNSDFDGDILWSETQADIAVNEGQFSVLLGSDNPISDEVFEGDEHWLEIVVEGELVEPRTRLTPAPYSMRVSTIDGATGGILTGPLGVEAVDGVLFDGDKHTTEPPILWCPFFGAGWPAGYPPLAPQAGHLHCYDATGAKTIDLDGDAGAIALGTPTADALLDVRGSIYTRGGAGDVNTDGIVDISDITAGILYLTGGAMLTPAAYAEADLDGDGRVTWDDLTILNRMAFLIETKDVAWRSVHSTYGAYPGSGTDNIFYVRDRVGLATSAPDAQLDVNGSIYTLGGDGDADLSGIVDISDITYMIQYLSQTTTFTAAEFAEADMDGDGRVTWDDLAILTRISFNGDTKEQAWQLVHSSYGVDPNTCYFYVRDSLTIGLQGATEALDVNGTARLRSMPTGAGTPVVADANGVLLLGVSSQKYKENVNDLHVSPQNVLRLRPVSFDWKSSGESDIGLIAEEVAEVIPELVIWDEQGDPKAVKYDRVAVCLLETVREQQRTIDELKTELASRSSGSTSANTSPSLGTCSGNATTNTDGYATVTLPEGLCAAGAEYRYQLTAVGAFAQAIVSQEVADGTFTIQTDQPNVTVSWQIVASAGVTSASHGTGDSADPLTCLDGKE